MEVATSMVVLCYIKLHVMLVLIALSNSKVSMVSVLVVVSGVRSHVSVFPDTDSITYTIQTLTMLTTHTAQATWATVS